MRNAIPLIPFLLGCLLCRATDADQHPDDSWLQTYYQHPSPERFESEVAKIRTSGALQSKDTLPALASFFSCLFNAADPAKMDQWIKFVEALPDVDQKVFLVAMRWSNVPAAHEALRKRAAGTDKVAKFVETMMKAKVPELDKISDPTPSLIDACWGAFFATGEARYALTVLRCAVQPAKEEELDTGRQAARWSLKSLGESHPKLREIRDEFYKSAKPEARKALDELLAK